MANPISENKIPSANSAGPKQLKGATAEPEENLIEGLDLSGMMNQAGDENLIADVEGLQNPVAVNPEFGRVSDQLPGPSEMMNQPGASIPLLQQVEEISTRAKMALGATAQEKVEVLKKKFGPENVRANKTGDEIYYKMPGDKKWRSINNGVFEAINDVFVDQVRTLVGVGGGIVGGIVGAFAGGGPITAGIAGGVAGQAAEDGTAALFGVERDPNRSPVMEYGMSAGLGAGGGWLSGKLAEKAAQRELAKKATTPLPPTANSVVTKVQEVKAATDRLKASPIGQQANMQNFKLMPHQQDVVKLHPEFADEAWEVSASPIYKKALGDQQQVLGDFYDEAQKLIGTTGAKTGADDVVAEVVSTEKFYGEGIKNFRDSAVKASKGKLQPMAETSQKLLAQGGELQLIEGQTRKYGVMKLTQDSVDNLDNRALENIASDMHVGMEALDVRKYLKAVTMVSDKLQARKNKVGSISLEDANYLYTKLTKKIDQAKHGSELWKRLIDLKNVVRADQQTAIGKALGGAELQAYQGFLNRYHVIEKSLDDVPKLINGQKISARALSDYTFDGGLNRTLSMQNLIAEKNPKLWRDIIGHRMDKLTEGIKDSTSGRIKWGALESRLEKMGLNDNTTREAGKAATNTLDVILEGTGLDRQTMKDIIKIGRAWDDTYFEPLPSPKAIGLLRKMIFIVGNKFTSPLAKTNELRKWIAAMGPDSAAVRYINSGAMDKIIDTTVKPSQRGGMKHFFRSMADETIDYARELGARAPEPVKKVGRGVKKVTEPTLRTKYRQQVSEEIATEDEE